MSDNHEPTTVKTMADTGIGPLVNCGSRVGPVFSKKDNCAFVKVSHLDTKRAVINTDNMTLVQYVEKADYPDGSLESDQSLFVPIFCKECYGTEDGDYTEALDNVTSCGAKGFIVGMCSVFGVADNETYPNSRKDFMVGNDMSFSGACQPQPGRVLFMHKADKEIGRVKCYWHVHSRSTNKTFLYCCVVCHNTEYASGVLDPDMNMGFSLGTVGDNGSGPVTEECSLVSVPMRPGCFCVVVEPKDLASSMIRMGFSSLKNYTLDAGATRGTADGKSGTRSQHEDFTTTVQSLKKVVLDQATEMRVLKDVLEAMSSK